MVSLLTTAIHLKVVAKLDLALKFSRAVYALEPLDSFPNDPVAWEKNGFSDGGGSGGSRGGGGGGGVHSGLGVGSEKAVSRGGGEGLAHAGGAATVVEEEDAESEERGEGHPRGAAGSTTRVWDSGSGSHNGGDLAGGEETIESMEQELLSRGSFGAVVLKALRLTCDQDGEEAGMDPAVAARSVGMYSQSVVNGSGGGGGEGEGGGEGAPVYSLSAPSEILPPALEMQERADLSSARRRALLSVALGRRETSNKDERVRFR